MFGYQDWRDVRNDIFLLYVLGKTVLLGYIAYDWATFHLGHSSYVLGWVWLHIGPETVVYDWLARFYMLGLRP